MTIDGGALRVGIVFRSYAPSLAGAEIAAIHTAAALAEAGVGVSVRAVGGPRVPDGPTAGFSYNACDLDGLAEPWPVDVVHLMDAVDPETAAAAMEAARRASVPLAFTTMTDVRLWQDPALIAEVIRHADLVCTYSRDEEAQMRDFGALHVARVHHGAALVPERDGSAFRRRHSIAAEAPFVLFLGRKMRSKGYRVLLEAMPLVWQCRDDVVAAFLGPRVDSDVEEVFLEYGDPRIIERDRVSDQEKCDALEAADVMCLPSTIDVFPLAVIEAWATRTPLVTARFADEDAVRDGVDGIVTDAGPDEVAEALLRLIDRRVLRERLADAGETRFRRDHDWVALAERLKAEYASLYRSAPGGKRVERRDRSAGEGGILCTRS